MGVPQVTIERLLSTPIPVLAMTLKDPSSAGGLNVETLKPILLTEVDKVKP
jgi:hypothetical protein